MFNLTQQTFPHMLSPMFHWTSDDRKYIKMKEHNHQSSRTTTYIFFQLRYCYSILGKLRCRCFDGLRQWARLQKKQLHSALPPWYFLHCFALQLLFQLRSVSFMPMRRHQQKQREIKPHVLQAMFDVGSWTERIAMLTRSYAVSNPWLSEGNGLIACGIKVILLGRLDSKASSEPLGSILPSVLLCHS